MARWRRRRWVARNSGTCRSSRFSSKRAGIKRHAGNGRSSENQGLHKAIKYAPAFGSVVLDQVLERPEHVHVADDPEHFPRPRLDDRERPDLVLEQEADHLAHLRVRLDGDPGTRLSPRGW